MQLPTSSTLMYLILLIMMTKSSIKGIKRNQYPKELIQHISNYKQQMMKEPKTKFILLWTPEMQPFFPPFKFFGMGQKIFLQNNCLHTNCFITRTHKLFRVNKIKHFSAILFNSFHLYFNNFTDSNQTMLLPQIRNPRQKYIFVGQETPDYYPICDRIFDNFFNWTQTYRLDSDIPLPYIGIRNKKRKILGPKIEMDWLKRYDSIDKDKHLMMKLRKKRKSVAWFVSHCRTASKREIFVNSLQMELHRYGMRIDIYGKCGRLKCPHYLNDNDHIRMSSCDFMLEKDYFFYLALENSVAKDYITEKALRPLQHYTVPIVYGGADYGRFLPPGSYIDALNQTIPELALIIHRNVNSIDDYKQFFAWRHHYELYDRRNTDNACELCGALNNKKKIQKSSTYPEFRRWWDPGFKNRCKIGRFV